MADKKIKVLISKDAMCKDYLHIYGGRPNQYKTPNLDELAAKGTVFNRHYTAAPSTVMSFYSMVTGKFAHETKYQMYEKIHDDVQEKTLFTKIKEMGYDESHIIWDEMWDVLPAYFDYFHDDVQIHSVSGLRESVGVHKKKEGELFSDDSKASATLKLIEKLFVDILSTNNNQFIWIHLPHVLSGRACYGSDIDIFDMYIGMVRKYVHDEDIVISADHGNMNGSKGKLAYGFDVYDRVSCIPLITPRINGLRTCEKNTSSVDLFDIVFNNFIPEREYVYTDSAYRAQKSRKLAIVFQNYKYIYTKRTKREELYDLSIDPDENFSLMEDELFDIDRKIMISIREEFFYNHWEELNEIRNKMRKEKDSIWRNGSFDVILKSHIKDLFRPMYDYYCKKRRK